MKKILLLIGIASSLSLSSQNLVDTTQSETDSNQSIDSLTVSTGRFQSFDNDIVVDQQTGKLIATITSQLNPAPPLVLELRHIEGGTFAAYTQEGSRVSNINFLEYDGQGIPHYLFYVGRQNRRVA